MVAGSSRGRLSGRRVDQPRQPFCAARDSQRPSHSSRQERQEGQGGDEVRWELARQRRARGLRG
eukprot:1135-Eustigmatos_ZCMA.PRE.1